MARREVVVETRNLSMHFGGVRAVDNVDFELREKELRCLIGPNGAGKSTFFKCLTGQLRPTSGDVVIRDIIMTGREPHAIAGLGVGIKTQVPNLFDELSAFENLWLSARRWHGDRRANPLVKETIDRLELGEIRSSIVGSLAHGQRQMVELGMVVAAEPWLVLLDEPAAGMTAPERQKTVNLLKNLSKNQSVIVVEHDMEFIKSLDCRVTVLHDGTVLAEGSLEHVSQNNKVIDVYLGR